MTETALLRLLPPVLRARDFRLYTQGGRRFVDLWQNGGRAILGHTPPNLLRELKNTANRGLMSPFPHPLEQRFTKALSALFPGKAFRIYSDDASLRHALESAGFPAPDAIPDPAFPPAGKPGDSSGEGASPRITLWRPFLDTPAPGTAGSSSPKPSAEAEGRSSPPDTSVPAVRHAESVPLLIPILPWPLSPQVLVIEKNLAPVFLPSDIVNPLILAAATRGIYDLIAAPQRGAMVFPKINKALYGGAPGKKWRRRGIYLTLNADRGSHPDMDSYAALFRRFLEGGFLLPPSPHYPLILPGTLSPGEEAKLAELLGSN
ncbi:hypothetical protein AGMMS49546_07670 [Spirochaetia bacterium]|nr:hypothetical protein AGMMS49546_07670 [Spirochaetia bacterium]